MIRTLEKAKYEITKLRKANEIMYAKVSTMERLLALFEAPRRSEDYCTNEDVVENLEKEILILWREAQKAALAALPKGER